MQVTTKYKIPTKNYVNIRPNKNNESSKSKHAQPEATWGRAANTKTQGEKIIHRKPMLEQHETTNKRDWKKGFRVLFY